MGQDLYEDLYAVANPEELLRRPVATLLHEHVKF